jgi:hypothetical protein
VHERVWGEAGRGNPRGGGGGGGAPGAGGDGLSTGTAAESTLNTLNALTNKPGTRFGVLLALASAFFAAQGPATSAAYTKSTHHSPTHPRPTWSVRG